MGGFAGFLDGTMNAVGQTGISLKSKREFEQESARFDTDQAQAAAQLAQSSADLTFANQENATRADKLTELERKRAWEAEDRATVMEYIKGVSPPPGWKSSYPVAAPVAPARGIPVDGKGSYLCARHTGCYVKSDASPHLDGTSGGRADRRGQTLA